jgi:hypothetical protein
MLQLSVICSSLLLVGANEFAGRVITSISGMAAGGGAIGSRDAIRVRTRTPIGGQDPFDEYGLAVHAPGAGFNSRPDTTVPADPDEVGGLVLEHVGGASNRHTVRYNPTKVVLPVQPAEQGDSIFFDVGGFDTAIENTPNTNRFFLQLCSRSAHIAAGDRTAEHFTGDRQVCACECSGQGNRNNGAGNGPVSDTGAAGERRILRRPLVYEDGRLELRPADTNVLMAWNGEADYAVCACSAPATGETDLCEDGAATSSACANGRRPNDVDAQRVGAQNGVEAANALTRFFNGLSAAPGNALLGYLDDDANGVAALQSGAFAQRLGIDRNLQAIVSMKWGCTPGSDAGYRCSGGSAETAWQVRSKNCRRNHRPHVDGVYDRQDSEGLFPHIGALGAATGYSPFAPVIHPAAQSTNLAVPNGFHVHLHAQDCEQETVCTPVNGGITGAMGGVCQRPNDQRQFCGLHIYDPRTQKCCDASRHLVYPNDVFQAGNLQTPAAVAATSNLEVARAGSPIYRCPSSHPELGTARQVTKKMPSTLPEARATAGNFFPTGPTFSCPAGQVACFNTRFDARYPTPPLKSNEPPHENIIDWPGKGWNDWTDGANAGRSEINDYANSEPLHFTRTGTGVGPHSNWGANSGNRDALLFTPNQNSRVRSMVNSRTSDFFRLDYINQVYRCYDPSIESCCDDGNIFDPGTQQCCPLGGVSQITAGPCRCNDDLDCGSASTNSGSAVPSAVTADPYKKCCFQTSPPTTATKWQNARCTRYAAFDKVYGIFAPAAAQCLGTCIDIRHQICCNGVACRGEYEQCCNATCCNRYTESCQQGHVGQGIRRDFWRRNELMQKFDTCTRLEHLDIFRAFWIYVMPSFLFLATLITATWVVLFVNKQGTHFPLTLMEKIIIFLGFCQGFFMLPLYLSPQWKYAVVVVWASFFAITAGAARKGKLYLLLVFLQLFIIFYLFDPLNANDYLNLSAERDWGNYFNAPNPQVAPGQFAGYAGGMNNGVGRIQGQLGGIFSSLNTNWRSSQQQTLAAPTDTFIPGMLGCPAGCADGTAGASNAACDPGCARPSGDALEVGRHSIRAGTANAANNDGMWGFQTTANFGTDAIFTTCTHFYHYFIHDPAMLDLDRYDNPDAKYFGLCTRTWQFVLLLWASISATTALILFVAAVLFVIIEIMKVKDNKAHLDYVELDVAAKRTKIPDYTSNEYHEG